MQISELLESTILNVKPHVLNFPICKQSDGTSWAGQAAQLICRSFPLRGQRVAQGVKRLCVEINSCVVTQTRESKPC